MHRRVGREEITRQGDKMKALIRLVGVLALVAIFLLLGSALVFASEDWVVYMTVTTDPDVGSVPGAGSHFGFGAKDGASDGYDSGEGDEISPPDPMAGINAYFYYPANPPFQKNLIVSVTGPAASITWPLVVKMVGETGDADMTISWPDISSVPAKYVALKLQDTEGTTLADMRSVGNYTFSASQGQTYNFQIKAEVEVYDLTVAADPEVGGTATDWTNESPYAEGTEVSIKAEAAEGYEFVNWTAPVGGFDNASDAETIFTMPTQNVTVTANFEEIPLPPEDPTVTTQAATNISTDSATPNMSYTVGNFSQVEVCFAYKESTGSAWSYTEWVSKSGNSTHAESLNRLSSNTEYDFKAQLKYDEIVLEGTTLQFTTDTSGSGSGSGGCFIATAAYGTATAEQIDVLREFRDVVLLESTIGSRFVTLYYQLSPPVADFISESSFLRTLVREFLIDPIVWVVEATGDIWQN
jgi:uncharacterized repeat protein (TIGR02543 family)